MKEGLIKYNNCYAPLQLQDFKGEAFLYDDCMHVILFASEESPHLKYKETKIYCINLQGPELVALDLDAKIIPVNLEITCS